MAESTLIQRLITLTAVFLLICRKGHYTANAILGIAKRDSRHDRGTKFSAIGAIQLS